MFGIFETTLAIITVIEHRHSWDTLPFINPLLWLNWITICALVNNISPIVTTLSGIIGVVLYGMCFWLCVGYGLLGYGVRQYEVLKVSKYCEALNISWQSDPRRMHFVRLHSVMLACGTLGVFIAFTTLTHNFNPTGTRIAFDITKKRLSEDDTKQIDVTLTIERINSFIAGCVVMPAVAGVIVAGVLNGHSYLVLGQKQCYASFVSARFGYIDLYLVEWKIKLATWIGLNT